MEYCPHCMHPVQSDICPLCGGQVAWQAVPPQLPVGTMLRSHGSGHTYQIGAARGQGGFGITYIGLDLVTRKRVAVKEYFPVRCSLRIDEVTAAPKPGMEVFYAGGKASFLKEAQMLAFLEPSPSIVRVYDYFEANETAYLVMEFVDGEPLYKKVQREGRMRPEELFASLPAFMRDLIKLHKADVVHRDISPDNLIWMEDGSLKLLDFGCARFMEDGKSMTVLLKHGFAPVEQYQTKGQGPWTDVYALAATIYYCLTGIIPPSSVERLDNDELKPLIAQGVSVTPQEEQAILWGMTVQPKFRPASVEIFAGRLFPEGLPSQPQTQDQIKFQPQSKEEPRTQDQDKPLEEEKLPSSEDVGRDQTEGPGVSQLVPTQVLEEKGPTGQEEAEKRRKIPLLPFVGLLLLLALVLFVYFWL